MIDLEQEILKANLSVLEERFPGFTRHLQDAKEEAERLLQEQEGGKPEGKPDFGVLEPVLSRSGEVTCRMGKRYLHSTFRPMAEAEKLVEKELSGSTGPVLFEGFGLGYQVEACLHRCPGRPVVILEPSARRFLSALRARPMETILSCEYVSFAVATRPEGMEQILSLFGQSRFITFRLRPLIELCDDEFLPHRRVISSFLNRQEVNDATLDRFAITWTRNLLKNREALARAKSLGELQNLARDLPVLLLAAGPSLDRILPHFPDLSRRTLVVAVDTAARALSLKGYHADILVVVDPQYWNSRHLDRVDPGKTILVSESSTHPAVFRHPWRHIHFCGSFFPLGLSLEQVLGTNTKLDAGGSVATTAFSLARFLGGRTIHIAGLDLGYPGGKSHFEGSFFEYRGHSFSCRTSPFEHFIHRILHDAGKITIPSFDGGTIASDHRLSVYRDWFASRIARFPDPPVFTITPESSAIEGIGSCTIETLLAGKDIMKEKLLRLDHIHSRDEADVQRRRKLLDSALSRIKAELQRLLRLSEKAIQLSEGSYAEGKLSIPPALLEIEGQILASSSKELLSFIIQPFLRKFACQENGDALHTHEQSVALYRSIAEAARRYLSFFP